MPNQRILVIRVNSYVELFHTRHLLNQIRADFPGSTLCTIATLQTQTLDVIQGDPHFDKVLLFPPADAPSDKTLKTFRRFIARRRFDRTIICFGATKGFYYGRHILAGLCCPGKKTLMDERGRYRPAFHLSGLHITAKNTVDLLGLYFTYFSVKAFLMLVRLNSAPKDRERQELSANRSIALLSELQPVHRILWMPVDGLGDIVMSRPALNALHCRFPDAEIDVLVRAGYEEALADLPYIDKLIHFEPPGLPERTRRSATKWEMVTLIQRLRMRKYDMAVDISGKDIYRFLAFASGAKVRVGPRHSHYDKAGLPNLSNLMTQTVEMESEQHTVDNGLQVMRQIGVDAADPSFCYTEELCADVKRRLAELGAQQPCAIMHAASAVEEKQWNRDNFVAVADYLIETYGLHVVLIGAPKDAVYNAYIVSRARHKDRIHNVAGHFSLRETPALFQLADMMVTNDSGPMHIAAAVGLPIVAMFLPGAVSLYHPYRQPESALLPSEEILAQLINSMRCEDETKRMIDCITVPEVIAMIDRKFAQTPAAKTANGLREIADAVSPCEK